MQRAYDPELVKGRLAARPDFPSEHGDPGLFPLGLGSRRDGLLYVPPRYRPDLPLPLVVALHGAGGSAQSALQPLREFADRVGLIVLAPDSRGSTWDVILGDYGPDVAFIDHALMLTFNRYAIDADRLAVEGFSDGASYALSLGLTNGDLFTHILAFAPGFMLPPAQRGLPQIFMSHGTRDAVLPIDRCSRRIHPQLERAGYHVRYQEFDGPHTVPQTIAQEAVSWLLSGIDDGP